MPSVSRQAARSSQSVAANWHSDRSQVGAAGINGVELRQVAGIVMNPKAGKRAGRYQTANFLKMPVVDGTGAL